VIYVGLVCITITIENKKYDTKIEKNNLLNNNIKKLDHCRFNKPAMMIEIALPAQVLVGSVGQINTAGSSPEPTVIIEISQSA
jgi:hypothetical protein